MTDRPLNATAAALLGLLHEGPLTGWDLQRRAQQRTGDFWTLTPSQVYRELTALARDGLVEVGPPGPRDRKPHTVTDAGRAAFAGWLSADPAPDQVRIPLLLTLAFAEHLPPGRRDELLGRARAAHAATLAGYEAARAGLAGSGDPRLVTLDYGIRHERAVLGWFDGLADLLPRG